MKNKNYINAIWLAFFAACMIGAVHAATHDLTTTGSPPYGVGQETRSYTLQRVLDLSTTKVSSNDVVRMLDINADTYVDFVVVEVEKATTNSITFDTGDLTSATQYLSNTSSTNAVATCSASTAAKFYASTNMIALHFDNTPTKVGVIRVKAGVTKLRADAD